MNVSPEEILKIIFTKSLAQNQSITEFLRLKYSCPHDQYRN